MTPVWLLGQVRRVLEWPVCVFHLIEDSVYTFIYVWVVRTQGESVIEKYMDETCQEAV